MKARGFTLMEVIVATLLLALITGGMFGIFVGGKRFVTRARYKIEAINLAREKMEELKSRAYADVTSGGMEWMNFSSGIQAIRFSQVAPATEGKRVRVLVAWPEAGIGRSEEIVTLIADPG